MNHLGAERFDQVCIVNGRFAAVRGALRACQRLGVECVMHERGSNLHRYALYRNKLPHDLAEFPRLADKAWRDASPSVREEAAEKFYTERRGGKNQAWVSFTAAQKTSKLPDGWGREQGEHRHLQ